MPFAATWMQLQIIILSKVSQTEKDKYHMISHVWNLKYDTNEPIYETENQRHREQTGGLPRGRGGWEKGGVGVWGQQMQTGIHRMDKQQGPTVQQRELYSISCDKP